MPLDTADLKAWREKQNLSQKDVAELIGLRRDSYGKMERGSVPVSKSAEKKLRALFVAAEKQADTNGGAKQDGDAVDPLIDAVRDLPPLALEPGPNEEQEGGQTLNTWQTLESELLKLLVGSNYQYEDFENGRPVRKTGHIVGLTDLLDGMGWHGDASLIRSLAPSLAHGYVEWGKHNRQVLGFLRMVTAGGAAKEALIPTAQLLIGLAMLHGLVPSPRELLSGAWGGGANGNAAGTPTGDPEPESA